MNARDATSCWVEEIEGAPVICVAAYRGGAPTGFIVYGNEWHAFYSEPVDIRAALRELDEPEGMNEK